MVKILLTCFPNDPLLLARMGLFSLTLSNYEEAIRYLKRLLGIVPHDLYALHQEGPNEKVTAVYKRILEAQPMHIDALRLLGTIAAKTKNYQRAVELIDEAIEIDPSHAPSYSNRGDALRELKQLDAALASYDKAIALKADYAEAYKNRGDALVELKQLGAALVSYDKAIMLKVDYAEAYKNRGDALRELKQLDAALGSYDKAIAVKADYAEAYKNRGNALVELKQLDAALASYDKAIAIKADYAEAYYNCGVVFHELRQLASAVASYDRALAIKADYAAAYSNRGIALAELKHFEAAVASFDRAIAIKPDFVEAYSNRGIALVELKQLDAAVASFNKAIATKADFAEAYNNRCDALRELKQLDAAVASCDRAIAIKPDYAEAYVNRGVILKELLQLDAAVASFDKAIEIKADCASAHWNLSLCNLLRGNFESGWLGYEWRWKNEAVSSIIGKRNFPQPPWLGNESLNNKTILLYAEQGLGDSLQFCRYTRLVAALGANIILEVPHPLVKLLNNLEGVSQVIARGDTLPEFDYQCPLLSLPLAFRTNLETIPTSQGYIVSNKEKVAEWQNKLGERTRPRIGMVWSGSTGHKGGPDRSLSLNQIARLLSNDYQFISLQKEVREGDTQVLAEFDEIKHFGEEFNDFTDTAALCELMDVVISVDTSVAHLAGALGKAVWILLPFCPDWRWLLDREDSPWYPTARLFRQPAIGDWPSVILKIGRHLQGMKFSS